MTRAMTCLAFAATLILGACGKKADGSGGAETSTASAQPASAATDVQRYPDEVPFGGTRRTLVGFTIYQAASESSRVLSRVGPNTLINLKASHSSWMLIEWPSGVGQLSLGWVNLDRHDTSKVQDVNTVDAGAVDAGVTKPDAGTDAGRRLRLPIKARPK